jgi:predicted RNA methylase
MQPATSFRDPAGFCCALENRILRCVGPAGVPDLEAFLNSRTARQFSQAGQLIPTRRLSEAELDRWRERPAFQRIAAGFALAHLYEHERVTFPSYPHEWAPEMLHAAGQLTLALAQESLAEGFGLKDATPHNVLFRGPRPVFVDVLSFERRTPGDPVWKPYAQFVRTFLLPLLAHRRWGLRLADIFTTHRDGLEPEEVYRLCGPLQKLLPPCLTLVSLPTWLARKAAQRGDALYRGPRLADAEKARFIVQSTLKRLGRALDALASRAQRNSTWSDYMTTFSYTKETFAAKEQFVSAALAEFKPARVLDLGANTGHFSLQAARTGAEVVAVDADAACVGAIWRQALAGNLNVLPLVVNLARPSAGLGWRNRECVPFLERAAGGADLVLMLAVLHHLLVTERVPLAEVLDLVAELTTERALIEFVGPQDEMFRRLTRGREHLHADLNTMAFESVCRHRFDIVRSAPLAGTHRVLYLLRKKGGAA